MGHRALVSFIAHVQILALQLHLIVRVVLLILDNEVKELKWKILSIVDIPFLTGIRFKINCYLNWRK